MHNIPHHRTKKHKNFSTSFAEQLKLLYAATIFEKHLEIVKKSCYNKSDNIRWNNTDMKTIFERPAAGDCQNILPKLTVPQLLPSDELLGKTPDIPCLAEPELARHYKELADNCFPVSKGFYPLGSCTMKHNPKVSERVVSDPSFSALHPLMPTEDSQGILEALYNCERALCEVNGMDLAALSPAAGAQGELAAILVIKAYHHSRGDARRTKVIVPDTAHGTNPATAVMAGYSTVEIVSGKDGRVDLDALKSVLDDEVAAIMLTNPSTLGIFETDIPEITRLCHEAGALCYYDGANLNAIMGIARPGDMGFDLCHLNLHKTFATPHGGGGPGSGTILCKEFLRPFLPAPLLEYNEGLYHLYVPEKSVGKMVSFHGNVAVTLRAYAYIIALGGEGLRRASSMAVLNANYLKHRLKEVFVPVYDSDTLHEFVASARSYRDEYGVNALGIAKAMQDEGLHPPTMYFPLLVPEALMFEPTETESKQTIDEVADKIIEICEHAKSDSEYFANTPYKQIVGRPDEAKAARSPVLIYSGQDES